MHFQILFALATVSLSVVNSAPVGSFTLFASEQNVEQILPAGGEITIYEDSRMEIIAGAGSLKCNEKKGAGKGVGLGFDIDGVDGPTVRASMKVGDVYAFCNSQN
jgi:hypothetical protein